MISRATFLARVLFLATCLTSAGHTDVQGQSASVAPDASARKALAYIQSDGERWITQHGCASCHQVPSMLWSLSSAAQHGLYPHESELTKWTRWSTQPVNFVKHNQKADLDVEKALKSNLDSMAALMLAIPGEKGAPWRSQFADALCREQQPDGSWNPCGQLPAQKRPLNETKRVTTLWVTLALLQHDAKDFDRAKAIMFADAGKKAISTEWYATRLLVAKQWSDQEADAITSRQQQLLDRQNTDGGWGWICSDRSDALATGIALYALALTRTIQPPDSGRNIEMDVAQSISKARSYLAKTQTESGSWKVPGTKKSAKGNPTPTANYWGTAWAVIGLTHSHK